MTDIRIQIEPPTDEAGTLYLEDNSRASLSTCNPDLQEIFQGLYSPSSLEADHATLFLSSGQMSPVHMPGLKDPLAGDIFLPRLDVPDHLSDFGSPISSASGDLVFETGSEYSSAPPSHPSSPLLSPSLSPLNSSFGNFTIGDDSELSLPSLSHRPRSSSFSVGSSSSLQDTFPDGRPRSASLAMPHIMRSQPIIPPDSSTSLAYPFDTMEFGGTLFAGVTHLTVDQSNDSSLGPLTGLQVSPYPPTDGMSLSPSNHHRRSTSLGGETASSTYLALPTTPQHGSFLQVPGHLQRRNAHRRNHTVAGVNGMGRGRSLEPRGLSRDGSPALPSIHLDTTAFGLISSSNSPTLSDSSTSPHSPASSTYSLSPVSPVSSTYGDEFFPQFDGSVFAADDPGIGRRNTYHGQPASPIDEPDLVHRSLSDSKLRKPPRLSRRTPYAGAGVFRTEGIDHGLDQQQPSPLEPSQDEMFLHSPDPSSSSQDNDFKRTVASKKIVDASSKRRKHAARFECSICEQKFTARHNLNNHLNSHNGVKAYHCRYCGQRATTAAVCARHERSACKKNPQSKKKK